jgi:hypothetical protein
VAGGVIVTVVTVGLRLCVAGGVIVTVVTVGLRLCVAGGPAEQSGQILCGDVLVQVCLRVCARTRAHTHMCAD